MYLRTKVNYEGYPDIIHGNCSHILDEVMAKAILGGNREAVTAEMTVKYLKPAKVNQKYKVGRIISQKRE